MRKIISAALTLAMIALMGYSGAKLWALDEELEAEQSLHIKLLEQKPKALPGDLPLGQTNPLAGLRDLNPDIIGWISIPYTNIDYPIVQSKDNDYYLRRDLNGEYAKPGTLFMDYRCSKDGSGYSIIYGHNMKSGAMLGTLGRFGEKEFFDAHSEGSILLEDGWHALRFFAFLITGESDGAVYSVPQGSSFFADIRRLTKHYREPVTAGRIVALSTCSYEYRGARMVLVGEMIS